MVGEYCVGWIVLAQMFWNIQKICTIFAYDKLHSAMWKQAFIALACIIIAYDKLHSAMWKQAFIALACIIIALDKLHLIYIR